MKNNILFSFGFVSVLGGIRRFHSRCWHGMMAVCEKCFVAELVYWIWAARDCCAVHPQVQPCPWGHQALAAPIPPKPVFSQYCWFYVTRISWGITFLALLSTESCGKSTLLIKMNQNPEAQTWLFLSFKSNAIFSNCVIPLVCWVQSEEDELELVSLGCCLLRDSKMLEMSFTTAF